MPHPALLLMRQSRRIARDQGPAWHTLMSRWLSASARAPADLLFCSASSAEQIIKAAASALTRQVHAKWPQDPPQLLQLLVRPSYPAAEIQDAGKYVLEGIRQIYNLEAGSPQQPQLIGGVLSAVAGGQEFSTSGPLVALLAAWLPGVQVHTFHATTPSLPTLPSGTWPTLMAATRSAQPHVYQGPWNAAVTGNGPGVVAHQHPAEELHPPRSWTPERPSTRPDLSVLTLSGHGCQSSGRLNAAGAAAWSSQGAGASARQGEQAAGHRGDGEHQSRPGQHPPDNVGLVLLSTPHFIQVEQLLQRLAGVLPGVQVVGGVSTPGAWSQLERSHGCVYHGEAAYQEGAVGAILHGRVALDTLVTPGFRPAGPVMEVTGAAGNVILELNGEPAHIMMQRALTEVLNGSEAVGTSIKLGLDTSSAGLTPSSSPSTAGSTDTTTISSILGYPAPAPPPPPIPTSAAEPPPDYPAFPATGGTTDSGGHRAGGDTSAQGGGASPGPGAGPDTRGAGDDTTAPAGEGAGAGVAPPRTLVARSWGLAPSQRIPGIVVAVTQPITQGTRVQLMVQDYQAAHRSVRTALRSYLDHCLTPDERAATGSTAALLFSCSGIPFFEQPDIHMAAQGVQVLGGKVEGEFAAMHDPGAKHTGAASSNLLHSYCSTVAFIRRQPGAF